LAASAIRLSWAGSARDLVSDQLQHIFVAGDDVDDVGLGRSFTSEGADEVVGLEAFLLEDRMP